MNREEILRKIEVLEQYNKVDSYNQILEIIDEYLKEVISKEEKVEFENKKLDIKVKSIKLKLEQLDHDNYKEEINLRGKLINLYKQLEKKATNEKIKMEMRYKSIEELKKHKETIAKYKKSKNSKISILEKVGLNILEISKTIEIFMKEKDVLTKVKNVAKETVFGTVSTSVIMGGLGLAMQSLLGIPFSLSSIANVAPVVAYVGLTSIIRNLSNKTAFEQYEYQQSDEYKTFVKVFYDENKEVIAKIANIIKEKELVNNVEEKISINESLVEKLDMLVMSTDIVGIKQVFELQALKFLRENKEYCKQIKDEYLDEKNNDKEKYTVYNKKLSNINFEIFKRENSIKDAIKNSGKSIYKNTKVMLIAKLILSCVSPNNFPLNDLNSILEPFAYIVINGLIDIPTYSNKLKFKETDYQGEIQVKNKRRIEELLDLKKPQPKLA